MKGRQKGRPTKWVTAQTLDSLAIGKAGIQFEIATKWKKIEKKLGTLTVSVGGLRWWPLNAKQPRQKNWNQVAEWFDPPKN